eukprot:TRINITY_DN10297_c0_g1_i1.p3 TRINITY_DN10297_c0_g1~~TRINITY_DN10297_c0_g1_i1.p3  ORF type:complete len:112 (-),score=12.55 TRINITY_DN10297_c0_g1_i1:106-441(-)
MASLREGREEVPPPDLSAARNGRENVRPLPPLPPLPVTRPPWGDASKREVGWCSAALLSSPLLVLVSSPLFVLVSAPFLSSALPILSEAPHDVHPPKCSSTVGVSRTTSKH